MSAVFLLAIAFQGIIYYVSPGGSDGNPGSIARPWQTIQHAADVLQPGDKVMIRAGVYYERVAPANSGSNGNYIVYMAFPGENAAVDGTGVPDPDGFVIEDKSFIQLIGLEIRNWNNGTAVLITSSHDIVLADCDVHDALYGISAGMGTHDFLLERVKIHHFDLFGFDASPAGGNPCYDGVLNDCVAYTGRDPGQTPDGFALGPAAQHDFTFTRCTAYDVSDGFDISARNTTLSRCAAYNCWNDGYKLWQDAVTLVNCLGYHSAVTNAELDWSGEPKTVTLRNCTFVDGATWNIWVENSADALHMYNCILASGDNVGLGFEQMGVDNYRGDNNLFHNDEPDRAISVGYTDEFSLDSIAAGAWTRYSGEDLSSVIATNPNTQVFKNFGAWDLHLCDSSRAIDKGTSVGAPPDDYDGFPRPYGAGCDIGAYEWHPPAALDEPMADGRWPMAAPGLTVLENPVRGDVVVRYALPAGEAGVLSVYDAAGRVTRSLNLQPATWNLQLPALPPGAYFLRLVAGHTVATAKVVKIR